MMTGSDRKTRVQTTARILSAYLRYNPVPAVSIAGLIFDISAAVEKIGAPTAPQASPPQKPAVNPKRSVFPDYIISLEDGARYKSLTRHLSTKYGMSPEDYRAKWNLAHDYPMVAPNFSASRSALAKKIGLGRKPKQAIAPAKRSSKVNPAKATKTARTPKLNGSVKIARAGTTKKSSAPSKRRASRNTA